MQSLKAFWTFHKILAILRMTFLTRALKGGMEGPSPALQSAHSFADLPLEAVLLQLPAKSRYERPGIV